MYVLKYHGHIRIERGIGYEKGVNQKFYVTFYFNSQLFIDISWSEEGNLVIFFIATRGDH